MADKILKLRHEEKKAGINWVSLKSFKWNQKKRFQPYLDTSIYLGFWVLDMFKHLMYKFNFECINSHKWRGKVFLTTWTWALIFTQLKRSILQRFFKILTNVLIHQTTQLRMFAIFLKRKKCISQLIRLKSKSYSTKINNSVWI